MSSGPNRAGTALSLDAIDWQSEDNPRDGCIDEQRIADLTHTDPDLWPPIIVAPDPRNGRIRGIDGYARYKAAQQLELKEIRAFVECFPPDVRIRGFELNQTHGFPLRIPERKHHAAYLKEKYPQLSAREIARQCGLAPNTVLATVQSEQQSARPSDPRRAAVLATKRICAHLLRFEERLVYTLPSVLQPEPFARLISEYAQGDDLSNVKALFERFGGFLSEVAQELQ